MKIEFINHASVKFYTKDAVILTDPWYEGRAFNSGWELIYSEPEMAEKALENVTHIWLSHEHPDHFSPLFFNKLSDKIKTQIEIIFQWTEDKRVVNFLKNCGLKVKEITLRKSYFIGKTEIKIFPSEFYDSYIWIKEGNKTILNINDCPIRDKKSLLQINEECGNIDLLLSQFSYAAWKGGRENRSFRRLAAKEKLNTMWLQADILKAKAVIPFASFVKFSHKENFYLNDEANTIDTVVNSKEKHNANLIIMKPFQSYTLNEQHDNNIAINFWREQYKIAEQRKLVISESNLQIKELYQSFIQYRHRMLRQNNVFVMYLLRYNPLLRALEPIQLRINDLNLVVEISILDGFKILRNIKVADIEMNSSSLNFIFKNDFGFDTLTVNGRFEATGSAFSKMTKGFALGSLNAMGLSLGIGLIKRIEVVFTLLDSLKSVSSKLKEN